MEWTTSRNRSPNPARRHADGGPKANPKPSLANGVPTIYTTQDPAELIVFRGQPDFVPLSATQLLWAANTTSDVFIDTASSQYYVLLSGRWFRSGALTGPWILSPLMRYRRISRAFRLRPSPVPCFRR